MTKLPTCFAGFVKFVGVLDEHVLVPDLYVGVHLDENSKYFVCLICALSLSQVLPNPTDFEIETY